MFFFDVLLYTFQDSCDIKIRNYSKNGGPRIYVKGENLRKGVVLTNSVEGGRYNKGDTRHKQRGISVH